MEQWPNRRHQQQFKKGCGGLGKEVKLAEATAESIVEIRDKKGTSVPKLLVIDKSVFHTLYQCEDKLCAFAKDYNVVLPNTLAVECLISENQTPDKDPIELLKGFDLAIKAGANMGYSSSKLSQLEKESLCPVKSVVDESATKSFRSSTIKTETEFIKQEAEYCRQTFDPTIESLLKVSRILYGNLCKQDELARAIRKQTDRARRFENWVYSTDREMRNIINQLFSEEIGHHANSNWFIWQRTRLYFTYSLDLMFKENIHGSRIKRDISNDFYDIEPVLYLLQADGLLTNDQKLQIPLANAAYPAKEVFVVDTTLKKARTVQDVFNDINSKIPTSYRLGND